MVYSADTAPMDDETGKDSFLMFMQIRDKEQI
jgi:hypothetical protein